MFLILLLKIVAEAIQSKSPHPHKPLISTEDRDFLGREVYRKVAKLEKQFNTKVHIPTSL